MKFNVAAYNRVLDAFYRQVRAGKADAAQYPGFAQLARQAAMGEDF